MLEETNRIENRRVLTDYQFSELILERMLIYRLRSTYFQMKFFERIFAPLLFQSFQDGHIFTSLDWAVFQLPGFIRKSFP